MSHEQGTVITADGPIDPDDLGYTLVHEHLFLDLAEAWFSLPDSSVERRLAHEPISIENLWYVRRNPMQHESNLRLDSFSTTVAELERYVRAGGQTIVDVTPKNTGGDPEQSLAAAYQTGLQLVHGTAHYTYPAHQPDLEHRTIEDICEEFERDVLEGIGETNVLAGLIGEIGLSGHIHEQEEKVIRAAARAAGNTGVPLSIHPPGRTPHAQRNRMYPSSRWGLEILDIVEEEGLSPERVALCHMDRTLFEDLEYQRKVADRGAYLEYDLWGHELYLEEYSDGYMSDSERVSKVIELVGDGYTSNLLFSHDICNKIQLTRYGGFGYGHVLDNVVPMVRSRGVSSEEIEQIIVENPKEFLTVTRA